MNKVKIALVALILPFLAASFMAMSMDNPKFNALILRDFKHEAYKPKLRLLDGIGYGDKTCISELNEANIKAKENSPLIPYIITIAPNLDKIATQQIHDEKEELTKILDEEIQEKLELLKGKTINLDESITQKRKTIEIDINAKVDVFNKRAKLMYKSVEKLQAIPNLPWTNLIPVEYLDDPNINIDLYGGVRVELEFDESQKLAKSKKKFEKEPTNLYFHIPTALTKKINNSDDITSEEERDIISMEIMEHIEPEKHAMRTSKIINRRPSQYDDLQELPSETLPRSNIVLITSNYHSHGENGYSPEQFRSDVLAKALQGQNPIKLLNKRQTTGKTTRQTIRTLDPNLY